MNLTNEDLLVLEERAKKATKGPWRYEVCQVLAHHPQNEEQQCYNRQYITAATPAVVLALIDKVRELEQLLEHLAKTQEHTSSVMTGWMSRCLEAESNLEPAMVDANRYRWLRQQLWHGSPLCVVRNPRQALYVGSTCPSGDVLDDAIDLEMQRSQG